MSPRSGFFSVCSCLLLHWLYPQGLLFAGTPLTPPPPPSAAVGPPPAAVGPRLAPGMTTGSIQFLSSLILIRPNVAVGREEIQAIQYRHMECVEKYAERPTPQRKARVGDGGMNACPPAFFNR